MTTFHEGARHLLDPCPKCGAPCMFSWDFKKLGKHQLRACLTCGVFVDGEGPTEILLP